MTTKAKPCKGSIYQRRMKPCEKGIDRTKALKGYSSIIMKAGIPGIISRLVVLKCCIICSQSCTCVNIFALIRAP